MRRIQIRLSTLLVMTLVAGVLVGFNVRTLRFTVPDHGRYECEIRGWPCVYSYEFQKKPVEVSPAEEKDPYWPPPGSGSMDDGIMPDRTITLRDETMAQMEKLLAELRDKIDETECTTILSTMYSNPNLNAALDLAAALGLVALTGMAVEFVLRRRAKTEPVLPKSELTPESTT